MIARALLTLGAYSPVAVLTGVRVTRPWPSAVLIAVGVLAAAGTFVAVARARRVSATTPLTVVEVIDKGADVPAYMTGYLLPFVTVSDPTGRDLAVLVAFGVVLLWVASQSTVITVNPLLNVIGLHVWEARVSVGGGDTDTVTLLARRRPIPVAETDTPTQFPPVTANLVASGIYLIEAP